MRTFITKHDTITRAKRKRNGQPRPHTTQDTAELPPGAARTLHRLYTNFRVAGSFSGVEALREAAAREHLRLTHRQVAEFLRSEPAYGIHRQQRVRFQRRRVVSFDINWLWELDVAFMVRFAPHNAGYAYLLVKIDVLSKQLSVEPMRTKSAEETLAALERICARVGATPAVIACDGGGEFNNDLLLAWARERRIRVYFVTQSAHGAANVVRSSREIRLKVLAGGSNKSHRRNKSPLRNKKVLGCIKSLWRNNIHFCVWLLLPSFFSF